MTTLPTGMAGSMLPESTIRGRYPPGNGPALAREDLEDQE